MLANMVFAAEYMVTVKGRLVTLTGETDIPYGLSASVNGVNQYPESGTNLNEDRSFEFKDISFKDGDNFTIYLMSSCSYHLFKIENQNGEFVVSDIEDSPKEVKRTSSSTIDLGNLVEDKSGRIQFNSDVVASVYLPAAGGTSAGYTGYLSNALIPGKSYEAEIYDDAGNLIITKTIMSSPDYCKTTLLTKSGNDITVSYCDNDQCGTSSSEYFDVLIKKGWNLLNMQRLDFSQTNSCSASILGMALYAKSLPGYVIINTPEGLTYTSGTVYRYTPANGAEIIQKEFALDTYSAKSPGAWLYSNADCTVKARKIKAPEISVSDLSKYELTTGWNLIGVDRWMIGKNLRIIFSKCDLKAVNVWNENTQNWISPSSTVAVNDPAMMDSTLYESALNRVIVAKVAAGCYLTDFIENSISPPALPQ